MKVNTRLLNIIKEKGITQKELAVILNTTEASISRYVNGLREPRLSVVCKMAKALNVSLDYLLGGSDEECDN